MPLQSALYLASNNPEQRLDNKFTRASGFVPDEWLGYGQDINHFQQGGGLNLRGYAGYLAPEQSTDTAGVQVLQQGFAGKTGAAVNAELDFDRYLRFNPFRLSRYFQVDTYLFADAGLMQLQRPTDGQTFWGKLRADAGVGTALTMKFGPLKINPLTLRFDMPLFVSSTPAVSPEHVQFRYVVGVNRAF